MRATSGDFSRVMQVVKDQICRALKDKHLSMELFKVSQVKQRSIDLENLLHGLLILKRDKLKFFQVRRLKSVLIFSILNHPWSFTIYYYFLDVFLS